MSELQHFGLRRTGHLFSGLSRSLYSGEFGVADGSQGTEGPAAMTGMQTV